MFKCVDVSKLVENAIKISKKENSEKNDKMKKQDVQETVTVKSVGPIFDRIEKNNVDNLNAELSTSPSPEKIEKSRKKSPGGKSPKRKSIAVEKEAIAEVEATKLRNRNGSKFSGMVKGTLQDQNGTIISDKRRKINDKGNHNNFKPFYR